VLERRRPAPTIGGFRAAEGGVSLNRMRPFRSTHTIAGAVALGLAALPASAVSALPDLVSERPGAAYVEEYGDGRLLLRFAGFVTNAPGAGPLEIRSSAPNAEGRMSVVRQWRDMAAAGTGGAEVPPPGGRVPTVVFEDNDDHNHYHLKDAAEYSLWNTDRTAQVALAQKTEAGFCIEDSEPSGAGGADDARYSVSTHNFCWQDNDTLGQDTLVMGISPGFRDVYPSSLAFQWVDISNVPPGRYQLAARVDPTDVIAEEREDNNGHAFRETVVPGHRGVPVTVPQSAGGPVEITLAAASFGDHGSRRFRILTAPAGGTLDVPVGAEITGSRVVYTPKPGYRRSDSFLFAAVDASSDFPLTPPAAPVTIAGEDVVVNVAGAPAELIAGLGVQLSAQVANAGGGVTWSVDGVSGGNATVGTITPGGLYVAPAAPPPGGAATIRATSVEEPSAAGEARIRIVAPSAQAAAPAQACAEIGTRRERASSGARVALSAGQLLINQRISQAAVRRANAIEAWLADGIVAGDICGGAIGPAQLGRGVVAGPSTAPPALTPAAPRPLASSAGPAGTPGGVTLSRRQLLINQRISQAAIRRLNGLRARLDGGLTGGDLRGAAVGPGKLAPSIRIVAADGTVPALPASTTRVVAAGSGDAGAVRLTRRQLVINQRIAQAAVRRANALTDELRTGLTGRHFAAGSIVARNLSLQP